MVERGSQVWRLSGDYQGRGLGSFVLSEVIARAIDEGKLLRVTALTGSPSKRFYVRDGFRLVGSDRWHDFYMLDPCQWKVWLSTCCNTGSVYGGFIR